MCGSGPSSPPSATIRFFDSSKQKPVGQLRLTTYGLRSNPSGYSVTLRSTVSCCGGRRTRGAEMQPSAARKAATHPPTMSRLLSERRRLKNGLVPRSIMYNPAPSPCHSALHVTRPQRKQEGRFHQILTVFTSSFTCWTLVLNILRSACVEFDFDDLFDAFGARGRRERRRNSRRRRIPCRNKPHREGCVFCRG